MKLLLATLILFSQFSLASEVLPFNLKNFNSDLKAGKRVALQFHASWCSTCIRQENSIKSISRDKRIGDVKVYVVDYDNSTDLKKRYQVIKQSTLILFDKAKVIEKLIGVTAKDQLILFFNQPL